MEKEAYMNKLEKYLMKQIEEKDIMIKHLQDCIDRIQHYQQQYFKEQRFINIVSEKAEIKSFESTDGTIKRYIDLGDINDYGPDQEHFAFAVNLLGITTYYDVEGIKHNLVDGCNCECCSDCECDDCFEGGDDDAE